MLKLTAQTRSMHTQSTSSKQRKHAACTHKAHKQQTAQTRSMHTQSTQAAKHITYKKFSHTLVSFSFKCRNIACTGTLLSVHSLTYSGPIAQVVERPPLDRKVRGSNPSHDTMALLLGRHYEFPQCGIIKGKLLLLLLLLLLLYSSVSFSFNCRDCPII
jgi:hypothetical protein